MQFPGHYGRWFPPKRSGLFCKREKEQSERNERPSAGFCRISKAEFPDECSASSFFVSNACEFGFNTAGAKFLFDFLNMRKQICLLIGALALLGAITGCGNAESAKSLGKKSEAEDDAAQFFKLGMKFWKLGMEYWSSGDTPEATEANLAAIECFRKAAEQGHASGQFSLGFMLYHYYKGIQTDYSEAAKWFRKAAEQGHARACFKIGWMYEHGESVPKDKDKAGKWFLKGAEQGHAKSQVRLANLLDVKEVFLNDIESIVDEEVEAAKWYQKAAEQGNGLAQMEIGDRYYHGTGVPQNDVEAYACFFWRKLADTARVFWE